MYRTKSTPLYYFGLFLCAMASRSASALDGFLQQARKRLEASVLKPLEQQADLVRRAQSLLPQQLGTAVEERDRLLRRAQRMATERASSYVAQGNGLLQQAVASLPADLAPAVEQGVRDTVAQGLDAAPGALAALAQAAAPLQERAQELYNQHAREHVERVAVAYDAQRENVLGQAHAAVNMAQQAAGQATGVGTTLQQAAREGEEYYRRGQDLLQNGPQRVRDALEEKVEQFFPHQTEQQKKTAAFVKKIRADIAESKRVAEYKPFIRIPLLAGKAREVARRAIVMPFKPLFADMPELSPLEQRVYPELGRIAFDAVVPSHLVLTRNDVTRIMAFVIEVFVLSKMFDAFAMRRIDFVTDQLIEHHEEVIEQFETILEKNKKEARKVIDACTKSHRMLSLNPLSARKAGFTSLFVHWLFYEGLNMFNRLLPKPAGGLEFLAVRFGNTFLNGPESQRSTAYTSLESGDKPFSPYTNLLKAGVLGKEHFFLGTINDAIDSYELMSDFYDAFKGRSPLFSNQGITGWALWFIKHYSLVHTTFWGLDRRCQEIWQHHLTAHAPELVDLLEEYAATTSGAAQDEVREKIRDFVQQGHAPERSGLLMSLGATLRIPGVKKLNKSFVAKASLLVAARLAARRNIFIGTTLLTSALRSAKERFLSP